jgi:mono/diheme cytochrome c family protein
MSARRRLFDKVDAVPSTRSKFASALAVAAAFVCGIAFAAEDPAKNSTAFFDQYCGECHYEDANGGLDLTVLNFDPNNRDNFATWVRMVDRVMAGEMPPKKKEKRPAPKDVAAFTRAVSHSLTAFEEELTAREGRTIQRRLNSYEYENALRDLLNVSWAQIKDKLPHDGEAHRFNKSGEALDISFVQMERYLGAADYAMRQAMSAAFERPKTATQKIYARDAIGQARYVPRENGTLPDRLLFPVLDSHGQPDVRAGRAPNSSPETREREAVGKVSSIFSDAGFYAWGYNAPAPGRYRIKLKGYSIWVSGGGIGRWFYEGQGEEKAPVYWLPIWHRPNADEIWRGRNNEPIGIYATSSGQTRPVGAMDFTPDPTVGEVEVQLAGGESLRTDGMRLFRTRVNGSDEQYVNPLATKEGMPGYAVQWLEVTGPLEEPNATSGYELLFDDLPMRRLEAGQKGGVPIEVVAPNPVPPVGGPTGPGAFGFGPGGFPRSPISNQIVEVVSKAPKQDAERLLRRFIKTAYRRPVQESEVQRFLGLFNREFALGSGFARSMLTAYTGVLVSPGYIFVEEKPGKLDDWALATRLSLFLWNSTPDAALRARAEKGELRNPKVLRAETQRLLNDARSRRFVDAFTDYWLDLRKIDDTSPSATLYNDYELDEPLKTAALEETQLFFAELVKENLPARNIVASDFTYLNERLANHYGIPGVIGTNMRRVKLPRDSDRGGLMTMASVLKVTANGTTTSPVLRGHWITERIFGIETRPPPPNVQAVEPDIRGAVTIRQQLDKHRENPSCASCHIKMDPPGFALENYDVMGARRDRYRAVAENVKPVPGYGLNGQAFAFHYGLPVDAAGELPDGRRFSDVKEFKQLILTDEVSIARNVAKQLVAFATGAPVRFSDRDELERILQRASVRQYGVRTLVEEIVHSELFQTK